MAWLESHGFKALTPSSDFRSVASVPSVAHNQATASSRRERERDEDESARNEFHVYAGVFINGNRRVL